MRTILVIALAGALAAGCGDDDSGDNAASDTTVSDTGASDAADTTTSGDDTNVAQSDTAAEDAATSDTSAPAEDTAAAATCTADPSETVVTFTTSDGITLEADFWPAATANAPAVVLLHMIPPSNNRTNYSPAFREKLHFAGFNVLNVDRRGAGGSSGIAQDAYQGANGVLDAVAARDFLAAADCAVDLSRVAFVGASNGTTTALDYAVTAAPADAPAALVFLTGGGYTENQFTIASTRTVLEPLPILFVFSTAESAWSGSFRDGAPDTWVFDEYSPGGHGTQMFGSRPESMDAVVEFLAPLTD